MAVDLINHNCQNLECKINSNQSVFSVYGKAKGTNKPNYRIINSNRHIVSQFVVDDCLLVNQGGERCDYLFVKYKNGNPFDGYFVEMKGKDIDKACRQVLETIEIFKNHFNGDIYGRIVATGTYPNFKQTSNYKKLSKKLGKNFKTNNLLIEDAI